MVQQMINSKFNEYGLATGTGFPTCNKQQSVPVKKTALRDLQNDNSAPKPPRNSSFPKESGPIADTIRVSGSKRPTTECLLSSPCHQSPSSSSANRHLVYVRRKSESDLGKSDSSDNTGNNVNCQQLGQSSHEGQEMPSQEAQLQEPKISCFSAFSPIPASLMTSSGGPLVPLSLGKSGNGLSPAEPNYPSGASGVRIRRIFQGMNDQQWKEQFLGMQEAKLSGFSAFAPIPVASPMTSSRGPSVPLSLGKPDNGLSPVEPNYTIAASGVPINLQRTSDQQRNERFLGLQMFLRNCDHSPQEEYVQMLQSLSSVGRSRHAVELEKRAIHLSLEEGKELQRMKNLNILAKSTPKNDVSPSTQQVQLEK